VTDASSASLAALRDLPTMRKRLEAGGLTPPGAELAARHMAEAARELSGMKGVEAGARPVAFFVPGRIELVGKHVDYAGGRSLVTAVERGFSIVAVPVEGRAGGATRESGPEIRFLSSGPGRPAGRTHRTGDGRAPTGVGWRRYPDAVARRFVRDAHETGQPLAGHAALAFSSSLHPASGLSSSSAMVVALHLALAARYGMDPFERGNGPDADVARIALAARLASVERGDDEDPGVGTEGGSQDHAAILLSRPGQVTRLGYLPLRVEGRVALPDGWTLAVGVSGVRAAKAAGAREAYNRLSREAVEAAASWPGAEGGAPSMGSILAASPGRKPWGTEALRARFEQFRIECEEIVPGVFGAMKQEGAGESRTEEIGTLVACSQELAETVLRNQVPETVALARLARDAGASAASAFGAGFGGAVWALVRDRDAVEFLGAWRAAYVAAHPGLERASAFFLAPPGPGAFRVL
jgi:galactokinase